MRRRQVVSALGIFAGLTAGCSNTPRPTPSPPEEPPDDGPPSLEVSDFATREGDDGDLVVDLTVYNPGEQRRAVQLHVAAEVGDDTHSVTREIAIEAGARQDYAVTVPVDYQEWRDNEGRLDFRFTDG